MDSAVASLALVAQLKGAPVDLPLLRQQFGASGNLSPVEELLLACTRLGFSARSVRLGGPQAISSPALPAVGVGNEGEFFVVARVVERGKERRYLVQRHDRRQPSVLTGNELSAMWSGELVFLKCPGENRAVGPGGFNLGWFVPALVKYRKLFAEVLVASLFLQIFSLVIPLFFQVVMDKVLAHGGYATLNVLAVGVVLIVAFEAFVGGMRNFLFSHTTNRVDVELGAKLFRHLLGLPLEYFVARQVGQTVARVRELETLRNFITGTALTLIIDLGFFFVFVGVLWYYSPLLTWVVLLSLPCYALLSVVVTPVLRRRLEEKFRTGAANQAFLTEAVAGIQTLKSQSLESGMCRRWEGQLGSYVDASFRAGNLGNVANQLAMLVSRLTTIAIVWWGVHLIQAGTLTVGQLVAFNMIAGRLTGPILKLVQLWQEFQQAGISLRRLGDILNTPAENGLASRRTTLPEVRGAITFDRVGFRYQPGARMALQQLSLNLSPGEVLGIVGRSGSGKSTVARLLQRLYVPEEGAIAIDGVDLTLLDTGWLRRQVGVVPQDSFLFNSTVRENIAIARPAAPLSHVARCASLAGAHEFILELPEGYDTVIEEYGHNLSGGQRQRIAIARALAADPRILVLDEATSSLDYESERHIQQNMAAICHGRTVVIIAHRLSTVRHCNRIGVLDAGRLVEIGRHEELLERNGYYARLYSYQGQSATSRAVGDEVGPRAGNVIAGGAAGS